MLKIGLTGNIGSGKSTVCKIFATLGVPVFYADHEAKKLYKDIGIKNKVKELFGESVFNPANEVDFKNLAAKVFSDQNKLSQLTSILHPGVFEKYHNWLSENAASPYNIHESAIIFEYGQEKYFDKIICVTAPLDLRIQRIQERDNSGVEQIRERVNNQMQEEIKAKRSDFLIHNDGSSYLIPQIMDIHRKLVL